MLEHLLDAAVQLERVRPRGADDGASAGEDPRDLAQRERLEEALDEPAPAGADADCLPAGIGDAADDGTDHRVEAGAVAAAREYARSARHAPKSARFDRGTSEVTARAAGEVGNPAGRVGRLGAVVLLDAHDPVDAGIHEAASGARRTPPARAASSWARSSIAIARVW